MRLLTKGLALTLTMVTATGARAEVYSITDLGTLGGARSYAYDVNELGQVTGWSNDGSLTHAFTWENGVMTDLGALDWNYSEGRAINNLGVVAGTGSPQSLEFSSGSITDLGRLPNTSGSYAYGINDNGQIVGTSFRTSGPNPNRAYLYENGVMTDISGGHDAQAFDINNAGQVTGAIYAAEGGGNSYSHAYIWDQGMMTYIDVLPTGGNRFIGMAGLGINSSGQVTGWSSAGEGQDIHAFLFDGASVIDLDPLGTKYSYGNGINDLGQVVGWANNVEYVNNASRAFLFDNGLATDLNSLIDPLAGWTLLDAQAINNKGQITGYGINADGFGHAYLLTPIVSAGVPEPASWAMMIVGFGCVGGVLRRRSKTASGAGAVVPV